LKRWKDDKDLEGAYGFTPVVVDTLRKSDQLDQDSALTSFSLKGKMKEDESESIIQYHTSQ
jgi:hypothetical protein